MNDFERKMVTSHAQDVADKAVGLAEDYRRLRQGVETMRSITGLAVFVTTFLAVLDLFGVIETGAAGAAATLSVTGMGLLFMLIVPVIRTKKTAIVKGK